jgi:hypothetical protein
MELLEPHLRRVWRWSLVSALFATAVPLFAYLASGFGWFTCVTAICALIAWVNAIIQTRSLARRRIL